LSNLRREKKRNPNGALCALLLDEYRTLRNRIASGLYKIKCRNQAKLLRTYASDPWKGLRRLRHRDCTPMPDKIVDRDGGFHTDPKDKVEALNDYFANVCVSSLGTHINLSDSHNDRPENHDLNFSFCPIDNNTLFRHLSNFGSPSAGVDGIPAFVLKAVKDLIYNALKLLINEIINTSTYPDCLKLARITPIPKNGPSPYPSDYRPISVLSVFNKVVERCLVDQMKKHIESNNLLNENQFGYRSKRSTAHAVVAILERLKRDLENGKKCAILCMIFLKHSTA